MNHPLGNVPIIGQPSTYGDLASANAPGLTSRIEIYDSEIIEIEKVCDVLSGRAGGGSIDRDSFHDEIKERFAEIGFDVAVNWYEVGDPNGRKIEGMLMPEIVIRDRVEKKAFDHDQQVHEVTSDLLELGDKGVIKTEPGQFEEPHKH